MTVSHDKKNERIKTRKMSIERKIAINGIFMGILICAVLIGMARHIVSEYLIVSTKTKTMALAEIAAAKIDGDLFDTLTPGDEKSEIYGTMQGAMFDIFNDKDITYVYTLKPLNEREVQFIVAAAPEGDPCQIGDSYDKQVEMEEAFKGKTSVTKEAVKDEWGVFYTAYAPIHNSKGQVVGIVGNVSSTIITIVNELVTTATTIIEYVQNNVMEDYEKFVQSGKEYNEDAKSIRQLMNGFKKETENLQQAMYEVDHSMGQIAVIIEESMERTTDVAKIAEKMDYNMQQMGEETKDNQKQIEAMNEVVSQYKVGI